MENQYILDKWEWTEEDFENMGWHDCPIYAVRFEDNIYLDIDYIFKWNDNGVGNPFTFWIAPATLVFESPYSLKIDIELEFINGLEIAEVIRSKGKKGSTIWDIQTQEGIISIGAEKYKQIIRRKPSFQFNQGIKCDERGDISFSLISEKNYKDPPEIIKRKEIELQSHLLTLEKTNLLAKINLLDKNKLCIKKYLLEKRAIQKRIDEIDKLQNVPNFQQS